MITVGKRCAVRLFFSALISFLFIFPAPDFALPTEMVKDNSCVNCHRTLDEERLKLPVALWAGSVHAEVGNTCDTCHGGDPKVATVEAMSKDAGYLGAPEEDETVAFCGKCHQELAGRFLTSQHGSLEALTCINCHGTHTIKRISTEIINRDRCTECHEFDEPQKLLTTLRSLHENFTVTKNRLKDIKSLPTLRIDAELDKTRKKLRQVRMITHTFDIPLIQEEADSIEKRLKKTALEIDRLYDMEKQRKLLGFIAVPIFILLDGTKERYTARPPRILAAQRARRSGRGVTSLERCSPIGGAGRGPGASVCLPRSHRD